MKQCLKPHWKLDASRQWGHYVPCGRCINCLKVNRQQWQHRLQQQLDDSYNAHFITLTYHEFAVPWAYTEKNEYQRVIFKQDATDFIKRLKDMNHYWYCKNTGQPFKETKLSKSNHKYYMIGEEGGKFGRPHFHLIFFNLEEQTARRMYKVWRKKGKVESEPVSYGLIGYITSYIITKNKEDREKKYPPFMTCSQGIGKGYFTLENARYHLHAKTVKTMEGWVQTPTYYTRLFEQCPVYKLAKGKTQRQYEESNFRQYQKNRKYMIELARTSGNYLPETFRDITWNQISLINYEFYNKKGK